MIELKKDGYIASGAFCHCYLHPQETEKCIKIVSNNKKAKKRLRNDISYYKRLHARKASVDYVADYLGTVQTNLGKGYVYQCVKDADGSVSKTLRSYLEDKDADHVQIIDGLREMIENLIQNRIILSDIHSKNILVQVTHEKTLKPVFVDGIGDHIAIKILNTIPSYAMANITRRWNKYIDRSMIYDV